MFKVVTNFESWHDVYVSQWASSELRSASIQRELDAGPNSRFLIDTLASAAGNEAIEGVHRRRSLYLIVEGGGLLLLAIRQELTSRVGPKIADLFADASLEKQADADEAIKTASGHIDSLMSLKSTSIEGLPRHLKQVARWVSGAGAIALAVLAVASFVLASQTHSVSDGDANRIAGILRRNTDFIAAAKGEKGDRGQTGPQGPAPIVDNGQLADALAANPSFFGKVTNEMISKTAMQVRPVAQSSDAFARPVTYNAQPGEYLVVVADGAYAASTDLELTITSSNSTRLQCWPDPTSVSLAATLQLTSFAIGQICRVRSGGSISFSAKMLPRASVQNRSGSLRLGLATFGPSNQ